MFLLAWLMMGGGGLLIYSGVKNHNPLIVLVSMLKGEPLGAGVWFINPTLEDVDGGSGVGIGGVINGVTPSDTNGIGGDKRAQVIAFAKQQLGEKYVWGAAGPNQWDCSGLTQQAYRSVGVQLPHNAAQQQQYGKATSLSQALPGDLLFWGAFSSHVAIYLGNSQMIHAPNPTTVVKIASVSSHGDLGNIRARSYL
jgi:hypothetical protein